MTTTTNTTNNSHVLYIGGDRYTFTTKGDTIKLEHRTSHRGTKGTVEPIENARVLYRELKQQGATEQCPCRTWDEGRCIYCGKIHY